MVRQHIFFFINSFFYLKWYSLRSIFLKSSFVSINTNGRIHHRKSNALLSTLSLSLLKAYPYHCTPLALARPSKVWSKFSKLTTFWLFSSNLTTHIALVMALSILLQIDISFSHGHHVSLCTALPILYNSDKSFFSSLMKTFFHQRTPHIS